jgi:hypothetical protein
MKTTKQNKDRRLQGEESLEGEVELGGLMNFLNNTYFIECDWN